MPMEKTQWNEMFRRAYCDVVLAQKLCSSLVEIADAVHKWIVDAVDCFSRFTQEVIEQWAQTMKTVIPSIEKLVEGVKKSAEDSSHSQQSFPHRRKKSFNQCKRNYLHLNTKGFCQRPIPYARSRC